MRDQVTLGQRAMRLALGATVIGAALAAQTAHAAVVEVNFSGNSFSTVPFNIDGFYLNVVTGAVGTAGSGVSGWDLNPYYSGATGTNPLFNFFNPTGGGTVSGGPLAAGSVIGATSTFATGVVAATQPAAGTYNFGFRFLNESTGITNYGYVTVQQLQASPLAAGSIRVLGYAYENSGASISVVPEPGTYLMMLAGLGLVGAAAARRRRA